MHIIRIYYFGVCETIGVVSLVTVCTQNLFSDKRHTWFLFPPRPKEAFSAWQTITVTSLSSVLFFHLPSPYAHHSPSTLLIGLPFWFFAMTWSLTASHYFLLPGRFFFLFPPPPSNMYKSHMEGLLLISTCWDFHLFSLSRDLTMQPALPRTHWVQI